jgi:hypothetical protein
MWAMVILLCLNNVPHDRCTEQVAIQVTKPIERYSTLSGCAVASMQILPLAEAIDDATHPAINCVASQSNRETQ